MRAILIGAWLAAAVPVLAQAQTRIELGDGVSVVFPSPPAKMHMANEPPPAGSTGGTARLAGAVASADMWTVRVGGATFAATAMTERLPPGVTPGRCSGPPLPVAPGAANPCDSPDRMLADPPTSRRVLENGALVETRIVHLNGHVYGVTFSRLGPDQVAKLDHNHETPPDSAGDAFVASFKVAARPRRGGAH